MNHVVASVPDFAPHMDQRLFSDEHVPALVRDLMLALARDAERPTSRAAS